MIPKKLVFTPRSSGSSNSDGSKDDSTNQDKASPVTPHANAAKFLLVPEIIFGHHLKHVCNLFVWQVPFGYNRKDVLLIGVGVTVLGIGLKSGLEYPGFFVGVDPLQAGNVVQLVLVLGLTIGWISTYIFRVSNKEMTYAQQLRDYENKVMQKRLEGLTEAELEVLLEQVEEEKRRLASGEQVN
ncbi:hypothetical protein CK203_104726 [Vitis vinifera]|uniref:Uncharacterized protein n=1 Tax=Vitis vinifera TaxID=29760 RepID=A0A438EY72_VITVI|nr:hypothetical protein CK203_104726 [Vitis vinifera]